MGWNHLNYLAADVKPLSERMGMAALNTVLGISIVFIVLVLISFIISLFKYINKLDARLKQKNAINVLQTEPISTIVPLDVEEDEEDDKELVAVITAAIYAFEAAQGVNLEEGDFLVHSIRKIKRNTVG